MTPDQEKALRAQAEAAGFDPDEAVNAAKRLESSSKPEPGKNDAATPSKSQADEAPSAGAESGAKAHGGRGYFAYEYPVLRVNEIRASLFMEPVPDGDLFYSEWAARHSGTTAPAPAPNNDTTPTE